MYVEIAKGTPSNRGFIIKREELGNAVHNAISRKEELYKSYYLYDEEILKHTNIRPTVRGYKGKYYLDKLIFDIDKGTDKEEGLHRRVKMFYEKLIDDWKLSEDTIRVWYSGRGFHILTPDFFGFTPSNTLPKEVAATLTKYFPESDNIYDGPRLIRVACTINEKSKLYKTQISYENLFSWNMEQIKEYSKEPHTDFDNGQDKAEHQYKDLILLTKEQKKIEFEEPSRIITCAQKIYDQGENPGSRHITILRLLSIWRRQGLTKNACFSLLKSWAPTMDEYELQKLVEDGFEKKYKFGCNDNILHAYCDTKCIFYAKKDLSIEVANAEDQEKAFVQFVNTDFTGRMVNLQPVIGLPHKFICYPKELVIVEGDTGTNKSTIVQNWLVKLNMPSILVSTENSKEMVYQRNVMIKYGMTEEQVIEHYKKESNTYSKELSHIHLAGNASIESLDKMIIEYEPKVVVVDVIEDLDIHIKDSFERLDTIGRELKQLANRHGIVLIGIHHLNKYAAVDEKTGKIKELHVHSGKGSSTIEQKADKVIAIQGKQDEPWRVIKTTKARNAKPFRVQGFVNPDTFRWRMEKN